MKTKNIKDGPIYGLLMKIASKMKRSGLEGLKASSNKYEILVTIKVKEQQK